jgi:hypothetical protein
MVWSFRTVNGSKVRFELTHCPSRVLKEGYSPFGFPGSFNTLLVAEVGTMRVVALAQMLEALDLGTRRARPVHEYSNWPNDEQH